MTEDLFQEWCQSHSIELKSKDSLLFDKDSSYYLLNSEKEKIFTDDFNFNLSNEEYEELVRLNPDYIIFRFGDKFYFSKPDTVTLNLFLYRGFTSLSLELLTPYLGVHGEYELCNGSRLYKDWCKKANFLGIKSLGLCELNTLGGVVSFQEACNKYGIKPIIGETLVFNINQEECKIIFFVENEVGFENLMFLNNKLQISESKQLSLVQLSQKCEGLKIILSNESNPRLLEDIKTYTKKVVLYQIDPVEWDADTKDKQVLLYLQDYLSNFYTNFPPVLVQTSYFLEEEDADIQKLLNKIGSRGFNSTSREHFFRSWDTIFLKFISLYDQADITELEILFFEAASSASQIEESCNFQVKLKNLYLPNYEFDEYERELYSEEEELFLDLIKIGLEENGLIEKEEYWTRVQEEYSVIKEGGFISYFLILWDIVKFCKKSGIWWGLGRGSAGGSLIAYLLTITQIDPLKYDLLFERFLNKGRLKKGLPDIDFDVEASKRDQVKEYMQSKYGSYRVTSIGTYQTLKLKSIIRDVGRVKGLEPQYLNLISKLTDEGYDGRFSRADFTEFIKSIVVGGHKVLRDFTIKQQDVVELMPILFEQCKNTSTHAAGVVIVPRFKNGKEVDIDSWLPVREVDGNLVTEWEGGLLDDIGFLKNDILGLSQLDKFHAIYDLILETTGESIRYPDMNLDSSKVMSYFQEGLNEDVFQFGASGLKAYCQELVPERIEDLIATVALYRPGPIFVGTHKKYIKLKNKEEEVHYHWGCEEITKETYGLIVYQEQAIRICQVVGGFSLVEADEVRKAMGKMIRELLEQYEVKFVEGAVLKGCPKEEAEYIWDEMSRFAEYSFNKSHAACYAITAYYSQWYKVYYPLQFWTVSLTMSRQEELPLRVSEINTNGSIVLLPPDINKSTTRFELDLQENKIYWSLGSIKWVSEKVLEHIFGVRQSGGKFFSLKEFISRVEKKVVNKRVITNLILSGAFDSLNWDTHSLELKSVYQTRLVLLEEFYTETKNPIAEIVHFKDLKDYEWILQQKELCSYGFIDYSCLYQSTDISLYYSYTKLENLQEDTYVKQTVSVIGLVSEIKESNSKRGKFLQVSLDINSSNFHVTVWNETYSSNKHLVDTIGKVICITGTLVADSFKRQNVLHTNESTKIEIL